MISRLVLLLSVTTIYAVVRYTVFGGVSLVHLPVYLLNKSISMAAVVALLLSCVASRRGDRNGARWWGTACWHMAIIHVFLSLAILSRDYFPKFFGEDGFNLIGEITILSGVLAGYALWLVRRRRHVVRRKRLLVAVIILLLVHLAAMGFAGWIAPTKWYGYLPPISLLSFFIVAASWFMLRGKANALPPPV